MPDETTEKLEVQATEPTEAEVQPEVDSQPEEQQEGLPDSASERTKREFEKLKKHNAELARQLAEKEVGTPPKPSLLEAYQPQAVPQPQYVAPQLPQARVDEIKNQLWDEQGTIDGDELQRRLELAQQAEARAISAERTAKSAMERVARYEADTKLKTLYAEYPELDPLNKDGHNEDAYDLVRKELLEQLWNGEEQDPLKAARKLDKFWRTKEVSPQQKETLQERQAVISKPASGNASSGVSRDYEVLRKESLHSKEAMEERIRRAGI